MGKVLQLANHRPHIVVDGLKSKYTITIQLLNDLISGKVKVSTLSKAYTDDLLPIIIKEWYQNKK